MAENFNCTNDGIYIENSVKIHPNVKIFPHVCLMGKTEIKSGTTIFPFSTIIDSQIGENCEIKSSSIENSKIENSVKIGPFSHIRPNSKIGENSKIGNFVEVKNSELGCGTKASHLSYIGDAIIGKNCNIGCGSIFVNYNGKIKNKTIVGDNCFIGSNANIIAPVVVESGTYICAGTTLTCSTKQDDFVIGRCRETIKPNRAKNYLKS